MNNKELKLAQVLLEAARSCLMCSIESEGERILLHDKMISIRKFADELNHITLYRDKDPMWALELHTGCPDFNLHGIIREVIKPYLELLEVYKDGS